MPIAFNGISVQISNLFSFDAQRLAALMLDGI